MKSRLTMSTVAAGISILAVLLAGCGGGTGTTPTPGTSNPPNRVLSGQVTYAGKISPAHQIIIIVSRIGDQAPAYSTVIGKPGSYTINNVSDSTYTVFAFMDLGDDMGPPQPSEPLGSYDPNGDGKSDEIIVKDGKGLTGINITLLDPK